MKYKMSAGLMSVLMAVPFLGSCAPAGAVSNGTAAVNIPAEYNQSGESVINSELKYYTSGDDKNCIYLTNGAELILTDSEAVSGGSSSEPENGLAAAVRVIGKSRVILENCKASSFGASAQALYSDGSEILMSGGSAFTDGENSDAAFARNGGSLTFDGVTLNTYGGGSDAVDCSDGGLELIGSSVGTIGESSSAVNQVGGSSKLTDSELYSEKSTAMLLNDGSAVMNGVTVKAPNNAAFGITAGSADITGGSAEFGTMFAELSGDFTLCIDGMKFITEDKDFLHVKEAPKGHITLKNAYAFGGIFTDSDSRVNLEMSVASFDGAINPDSKNGTVTLSMDESSSWSVSDTSYIAALVANESSLTNIKSNGFNVYYSLSDENNSWLGGKTYELDGGGALKPQ